MLGFSVPSSGRHFRCSSQLLILTICGQLWFPVAHVDILSFLQTPVLFQRPLSDRCRASIVPACKLIAQVPASHGYTNAFDLETNLDCTGALFRNKPGDAGLASKSPIISGGGSTKAFSGLVMALGSTDLGVNLRASVE